MKPFSKTYYTDKFNITVRIKREIDEMTNYAARLSVKKRIKWNVGPNSYYKLDRIVYTYFANDKNMFKKYKDSLKRAKVPKKTRDEIILDIRRNLFFEEVTTYVPLEKNEFLKQIDNIK